MQTQTETTSGRFNLDETIAEIERHIQAARETLSMDGVLGNSPWVRLGASTAVGFAVGLAGGRVLRSGLRFALALGARRIVRYAFDAAFDAGQAHAAADRSAY